MILSEKCRAFVSARRELHDDQRPARARDRDVVRRRGGGVRFRDRILPEIPHGRGKAGRALDRAYQGWDASLSGYGTILACRAFAYEECGDYAVAEPAGLAALDIDPGDFWGAHALAHVMEMQGRPGEGIDLLEKLERHWDG